MNDNCRKKIDRLIINSPFEEPKCYWQFDEGEGGFRIKDGRRKAGYVIPSQSKKYTEHGEIVEIPLVNTIRSKVKKWREAGYQGVTGITKRLLEFWRTEGADGRDYEFFFCQLEAIETLIWYKEAPSHERGCITIEGDGGEFERLCCKMATGTGKTYVMAMAIAWQILNKVTYRQDARFSKNIFIVAPNLTVKSRLKVLDYSKEGNYYEENKIVPRDLLPKLRQGRILVTNWHALMDETKNASKQKTVDKRGPKSNKAWIRSVLGNDMENSRNILVINDEAHHAWRTQHEDKRKGIDKKEEDRATCWVKGLDRIHKTLGILTCFDFSATPFAPSGTKGKTSYKADLFGWIVSDFGLMDAIESGLTKTPRFVVRDDAPSYRQEYRSQLYHIYDNEGVKDNLKRRSAPEVTLPDLVRNGYLLLGHDWQKTLTKWQESEGNKTPPVMISVVNRKETADRVEHLFIKENLAIDGLCDPDKTLLIYSDIDGTGKKEKELREKVNTVGQLGKTGEQIRHVISVVMLSEGWDCRTVTHIMGLRAFSSQLLCEQIVGRGLRRASYDVNEDGMFDQEYVNIFGIPFAFIPQEDADDSPRPTSNRSLIGPDPDKIGYQITWPNIERIDYNLRPELAVDFSKVDPLELSKITEFVELAPEIDGQPDYDKITTITLQGVMPKERLQTQLMRATKNVYAQINSDWKKKINEDYAMRQLFAIVEDFVVHSDRIRIESRSFQEDDERRRIAIMMGMEQIVSNILDAINSQNSTDEIRVLYRNPRFRSTKHAGTWRTGRKVTAFKKTHHNLCVFDSGWEEAHASELDSNPNVVAWAKNDHLGFEIPYIHENKLSVYIPDFLVKLANGEHLILEVKGQQKDKDISKWDFIYRWTKAVSQDDENGQWHFEVSTDPTGQKVHQIIGQLMKEQKAS